MQLKIFTYFIFFSLISVSYSPAYSDSSMQEPFVLKGKYWNIVGRKIFSKFFSPANHVLLMNFSLTWTNYDESLHRGGFDFKGARSKKLVAPTTPGDCSIKLMGGSMSPQSIPYNGISVELTGYDCQDISDEIPTVPMRFELEDVPALFSRTRYSKVSIEIEDTP